MKKVRIQYKERLGLQGRIEKYETNPYDPEMAKQIATNLEIMGGFDFRFVPVNQ